MKNSIFEADDFEIWIANEKISSESFRHEVRNFPIEKSERSVPFSIEYNLESFLRFFAELESDNEILLRGTLWEKRIHKPSNFSIPTSGTTGKPKRTHYDYRKFIEYITQKTSINGIRSLCLIPLNHIGSINALFEHVFRKGSVHFLCTNQHLNLIEEVLNYRKINNLVATPSIIKFIDPFIKEHNPFVTKVILGGEPLDKQTLAIIQSLFPNAVVKNRYGLTETGIIAQTSVGNTGISISQELMKIVDGKIHIKKPKYILNSEEWICTGDVGVIKNGVINSIKRSDHQLSLNGVKLDGEKLIQLVMQIDGIISASAKIEVIANSHLQILSLFVVSSKNVTDIKSKIRQQIAINLDVHYIPSKIEINLPGKTKFL